ncbi:FkbM family methyltransferase [bacterium]|nr:FkbM family methyltransferase [bacterium]
MQLTKNLLRRFLTRGIRAAQNILDKTQPEISATPVKDMVADILGQYGTVVLNVGARWGDNQAWWRLDPVASVVGFEADPQECERLNASSTSLRRERYLPYALGASRGEGTLYITREPACSSLYAPDMALAKRFPQLQVIEPVETRSVSLIPLDEWWNHEDRPDVSFLKLDTQGSELDILRGSTQVLEQALGCEIEVEFSPLYKGQPIFSEVDTFLREKGFSLWALRDTCSYSERPGQEGPGRLYWANAVYLRDYAHLPAATAWKSRLLLAAFLEALGDKAAAHSCLNTALAQIGDVREAAGFFGLNLQGQPA